MFDGQFYPGQPIQFMDGLLAPVIGAGGYKTFFSEYAVGVQPSDWTSRFNAGFTALVQTVAGSLGGKALRWTKTVANRQLLSWDRVPLSANTEILMRMRVIEAAASVETFLRPCVRAAGAIGTESYYVNLPTKDPGGTGWNHGLSKTVSGTVTTLGTVSFGPSPTFAINTWFWERFRVNGTSIQRRSWWDGAAEPGTWDETVTDSSVTAAGWTGIASANTNPDCECDFFSVGLNGETAPSP